MHEVILPTFAGTSITDLTSSISESELPSEPSPRIPVQSLQGAQLELSCMVIRYELNMQLRLKSQHAIAKEIQLRNSRQSPSHKSNMELNLYTELLATYLGLLSQAAMHGAILQASAQAEHIESACCCATAQDIQEQHVFSDVSGASGKVPLGPRCRT